MVEPQRTWKDVRKHLVKARIPTMNIRRYPHYAHFDDEFEDLRDFTLEEQECMLTDEMRCLLMGHQMENIRVEFNPKFTLKMNPSLDPNVRGMMLRFERVLINCSTIRRRCDQILPVIGVSTAVKAVAKLCEELLDKELAACIDPDQTGAAQITELFFMVSHFDAKIQTAASVLEYINDGDLVGGEVLSILETQLRRSVSQPVSDLLEQMIEVALVQFLSHLREWICNGTAESDVTSEFIVWPTKKLTAEQLSILRDTTQPKDEKLDLGSDFIVLEELCPSMFSSLLVDIVRCGKYLHILGADAYVSKERREASLEAERVLGPRNDWLKLPVNAVRSRIIAARDCSSSRVLRVLKDKYELADLFLAVQDIFLVSCADWVHRLIVDYSEMLSKPADSIREKRLEAAFGNVVLTSSLKESQFIGSFKLCFEKSSVFSSLLSQAHYRMLNPRDGAEQPIMDQRVLDDSQLSGWHSLSVKFNCPPVLTPLFTNKQIRLYSYFFRIIFASHVALWMVTQCQLALAAGARQEQRLLQSLSEFVRKYMQFCMHSTILPLLAKYNKELFNAASIEEMASKHDELLLEISRGMYTDRPKFMEQVGRMFLLIQSIYSNSAVLESAAEQYGEIEDEIRGALCDGSDEQMAANYLDFF